MESNTSKTYNLVKQAQFFITAPFAGFGNNFGYAVALSSDGNTALVGALGKRIGFNDGQGAAYVFVRRGSSWRKQARLAASNGAEGDAFGSSVALSSDGNTALVGATNNSNGTNPQSQQGAAYVFTRVGKAWSQQAYLVASDSVNHFRYGFGKSVALSKDGSIAIIGALDRYPQGAVYIFTRINTIWTEQTMLTASDGTSRDYFGCAVKLSEDNNTLVVGAFGQRTSDYKIGSLGEGAVYIFTHDSSTTRWTQQARLIAPDGEASDQFGNAVALSADGNTVLIGATGKMTNHKIVHYSKNGAAYVFTRSGSVWNEVPARLSTEAGKLYLGNAVALSIDGNRALVSSNKAISLFTRTNSDWKEQAGFTRTFGYLTTLTSDGNERYTLALTSDGSTVLVGIPDALFWPHLDIEASSESTGTNDGQGTAYILNLHTSTENKPARVKTNKENKPPRKLSRRNQSLLTWCIATPIFIFAFTFGMGELIVKKLYEKLKRRFKN